MWGMIHDVQKMMKTYDVAALRDGWNINGETGDRFFYVSNPAGLWAYEGRFEQSRVSHPAKRDTHGGAGGKLK